MITLWSHRVKFFDTLAITIEISITGYLIRAAMCKIQSVRKNLQMPPAVECLRPWYNNLGGGHAILPHKTLFQASLSAYDSYIPCTLFFQTFLSSSDFIKTYLCPGVQFIFSLTNTFLYINIYLLEYFRIPFFLISSSKT